MPDNLLTSEILNQQGILFEKAEPIDSNDELVLTSSEFETVLKEESKPSNSEIETSPDDSKTQIKKEPKIEKQQE